MHNLVLTPPYMVSTVNSFNPFCVWLWNFPAGPCSRNFTLTDSNPTIDITSTNYPANYPNNEECIWFVSGPDGKHIYVEVINFNTELLYDLVTIGNLLNINDLGSATISTSGNLAQTGTERPPAFLSTGEIVWARFVSDGSKTEDGFTIRFTTRDDAGTYSLFSCSWGRGLVCTCRNKF